ncbi:hypothetical protein, partial [Pseudomonas sp. Sample_14]|uniref:hypothetical protein n=1 Tax=Pseudomonas sp. Sample_14 TaxID=2448262 RepID=UPI0015B1522B
RVNNFPVPEAPWSKVTYVNVDLSISRLPAATIWVNNQNVTTIDLKVLGTSDADARVYFTPPDFQIGDEVELRCTGQTPEGVPVTIGPLVHTVGAVPGHFDFKLANASIRAMVNGSATTNYKLLRANVPARPSNDVVVTVTGEVSQLKPPTVVEAPDYKLDPNRHQNGFTVVFDTAAFGANHEVKLEIAGRPGAGSVPPQQKPVAGQSKVQFDIDFSVTGANLQRTVELIYSLIVNGQPTPVQSVTLVIGELLQSSMPMPKIEGFDGEVLDVGLIKDDTKVLCGAWPFQRMGLPIWLEYVETFAGGGERVKQQFVGAAHDQEVGLSYLAEVEWLRGCKVDSKLLIKLRIGFFEVAAVLDAISCRIRCYGVHRELSDLTDFTDYNWNYWLIESPIWTSRIVKAGEEYFLESFNNGYDGHQITIYKLFYDIIVDAKYELSFDYKSSNQSLLRLFQDNALTFSGHYPQTNGWQHVEYKFSFKQATVKLSFWFGDSKTVVQVDNLKILKI